MRKRLLDLPRRLDEGDTIAIVLLDARCHGEDVRIEDDILGREAGVFGQELVGAGTDWTLRSSVSACPSHRKP